MSFVACRMPSADELALMQQLIGQAKCDVVGRVTPADSTQPRRAGPTRRFNSPTYPTDQFTTQLYAVPSTTTPNTMRYHANTVKS